MTTPTGCGWEEEEAEPALLLDTWEVLRRERLVVDALWTMDIDENRYIHDIIRL